MSRQKSHATIEREREREIRRQRRELKRAEREAKRAARAEKARHRELAKNASFAPSRQTSRELSIFDLRKHDVLHLCKACRTVKHGIDMKTRDLCEACYYNIELGGDIESASRLEAQGRQLYELAGKAAPRHGSGESKNNARDGQGTLEI